MVEAFFVLLSLIAPLSVRIGDRFQLFFAGLLFRSQHQHSMPDYNHNKTDLSED